MTKSSIEIATLLLLPVCILDWKDITFRKLHLGGFDLIFSIAKSSNK